MPSEQFGLGDMVWSRVDLQNDGSFPEVDADTLLAPAGSRGVVVRVGSLEDRPEISVYLVRFEDASGVLGEPVGCFAEELTQDEALASTLAQPSAAP